MHGEDGYPRVADYFVVAGLTDSSKELDEDLAFPDLNHKLNSQPKDPITDICVIDRTLEEKCPQGFTCIEKTPSGLLADLNHGSFTAHSLFLCYRRGKDRPPLVDLGVYYEGLENVKSGISIVETTATGKNANVNNKSGMGSFPIYLTYRRAEESAPQSTLVVTDVCIILTNKNEYPPYAYCLIDKNLNKGMIGSSVFLCYKKSMRQVNSIAFRAGMLARYPPENHGGFPLPETVPLFCLPMGATIECWSKKTKHPLPAFSSFVLTTETSEKIYGAVVSFYELYPEERLIQKHKFKLGLLRGDGHKSQGGKTLHTNKAICMLSRWPLFDAFRDFLIYLYRLTVSPIAHAIPIERHIAHFMQNVPFPSVQRPRVQYQMSPMHATILTRPQMTPIPLSGASFLALVDDLGSDNVLTLLALALTEHKIVIHSLRRAEITRVAEAMITLLFPFKWQCTYVPLCPLEMAYVLEAPCPFIVGVDSRYFDLYEPPPDVACVNLDTNNITLLGEKKATWKIFPKKAAKQAKNVLENLFVEIKQTCPRTKDDEGEYISSMFDPELTRMRRHMQIELQIQETVLKLMASMMSGYREYLLPIVEAPSTGTTDPSSLFNIQSFIRSREKSSQRFFSSLTGTQLFAAFIEERSFASFGKLGNDEAGKAASLVFFDDCIERLESGNQENVKLIEADDALKSEHTVFILPPDEKDYPSDVGYQYTTFPVLQEELFGTPFDHDSAAGESAYKEQRRKSGSFVIGRRTKQETRLAQKQAKLHSRDSQMWARILLANSYSIWFGCLPEFTRQWRSKAAILRAGHDMLHLLQEKGCLPLPDETCYRVLMHLCYTYNKPVLAVRVFHFIRNSGTQLSAITYGLYNKAVLESTWPESNRDGYMLWRKLRNVLQATAILRQNVHQFNNNSAVALSQGSKDWVSSLSSLDETQPVSEALVKEETLTVQGDANVHDSSFLTEDSISTGGQSDPGYNSMPKSLVQRGSSADKSKDRFEHDDSTETKSTETTDSVISSISEEPAECQPADSSASHNQAVSIRTISPPKTLSLTAVHSLEENQDGSNSGKPIDQGLQSDDTVIGGAPFQQRNGSIVRTPVSPVTSPTTPPTVEKFEDSNISSDVFTDSTEADIRQTSDSEISANPSDSREILSFFGDDSKLMSSLSESDKQMHLELRGKKSSISQSPPVSSVSVLQQRENSISPLVGANLFSDSDQPSPGNASENGRAVRKNFDNLTAEDIASSPSPKLRPIFGSGGRSSMNKSKIAAVIAKKTPPRDESPAHKNSTSTARALTTSKSLPAGTTLKKVAEEGPHNAVGDPEATDGAKGELAMMDSVAMSTPENKQLIERHDITDLALDPLSLSFAEANSPHVGGDGDGDVLTGSGQHLVDEIQQYLNKESTLWQSDDGKEEPEQEAGKQKLSRQSSAPGDSPVTPRHHPPPGLLSRSLTFAQGSTLSNSLMSSGSKLNSLLKATTLGMATKAKKLASNLAKDINETVQTNLAYYTPEKFKGSLPELSEGHASPSLSTSRSYLEHQRLAAGSQTSLQSGDSMLSSSDFSGSNDIRYRGGTEKKKQYKSRPLSVPSFGSSHDVSHTHPSVPDHNKSASDLHLAGSMSSLQIKEPCDVEVMISSCSKCSHCSCLVYDEEIMAGWLADESNLNTHCPFCNTLFVPFLDIEVKDYKRRIRQATVVKSSVSSADARTHSKSSPRPPNSPTSEIRTTSDSPALSSSFQSPSPGSPKSPEIKITSDDGDINSSTTEKLPHQPTSESNTKDTPHQGPTLSPRSQPLENLLSPSAPEKNLEQPSVESLTVPYLSPLVLRKELESLLENEGTKVLSEGEFVDQHPIIYWNLVWYFRRLNLHSNLYDLVLMSKLTGAGGPREEPKAKSHVMVYVVWDNLKLHENMAKPPLYRAYHQLATMSEDGHIPAYPESFLEEIKKSIIADDVRAPLVALLNEFSAHSSGANGCTRRSAYREVLFLVIVALGKECIDVDAFDVVYAEAYGSLTMQELELTRKCDRPPTSHARECRNMFGQMDLN